MLCRIEEPDPKPVNASRKPKCHALCILSSLNRTIKSTLFPSEKPQTTPKNRKKPSSWEALWSSSFWRRRALNAYFLPKAQSSRFIHLWKHSLPAMFNVTKMQTAHGGNIRSMLKNSWERPGETLHKLRRHSAQYLVGTFLDCLRAFSDTSEGMLGKCYGKRTAN